MSSLFQVALFAVLWIPQAPLVPAYVREGDRVENEFRSYRDDLERFYASLRDAVDRKAPGLLADLDEDPPPEPVVYGYQLLPPLVPSSPESPETGMPAFRSYSWPATDGYIDAERERLRRARMRLDSLDNAGGAVGLADLVGEYHVLVDNQESIDQHIQYNRFWQRSVDEDRERFDEMTALYELALAGDPDTAATIREALGEPAVPPFVTLGRDSGGFVVRLPVYTDIADPTYLAGLEALAEEIWQASDDRARYRLDILFQPLSSGELYAGEQIPARGAHIDLSRHLTRFRGEGGVLTTGAESTHALVGQAVVLGAGALTAGTLAHEVGHLLGFRDGYLRGYRDLESQGFEILELTSDFDDIMTAPRSGSVRGMHFELIVRALE